MVESSRLVFKLLCVKLRSLNFDFIMDTTTQFNLHHSIYTYCVSLVFPYFRLESMSFVLTI